MKSFDPNYVLIQWMYEDGYFPNFLADKVRDQIQTLIAYLETGETDLVKIQDRLDTMTSAINDLQEEFEENDSEIETVARDSIGMTVEYILSWFAIAIDMEEAIRERDW